jgi:peptidoglycan/LPS O-acetylase OafA/YrhL
VKDKNTLSNVVDENNFDLIRLFAASQVALKHILLHLEVHHHLIDLLSIFPGVPIFFFISGFLIFKSFLNTNNVKVFSGNRILRIYPALIGCFLFSISLVFLSGYFEKNDFSLSQFWIWTVAQLTFFQIYNPEFLRGFGVGVLNGSLWTIAVELQFYILTPVLFWLICRRYWLWYAIFSIFLIVNLLSNFLGTSGFLVKLLSISSPSWFYMFVFGAWLSTKSNWQQGIKNLNIYMLLIIYLFFAYMGWLLKWPVSGNEINPISYILLSIFVFKMAYIKPNLAKNLLAKNDISYGIYIYHMPIVNFMIFYKWIGKIEYIFLAFATTCIMAALSWFVIERPALRLKRRALRKY